MSSMLIDTSLTYAADATPGGASPVMLRSLLLASTVVLFAIACSATSARADVIEIDDAGNAILISAPPRPAAVPAPAHPRAPRPALAQLFRASGEQSSVSDRLIEAVAWTESRFDVGAVSPKGARGVMQLMPGTARGLGVDPGDPAQNIRGGAAYLRALLDQFDGDIVKTLAAYNAGPNAVRRHGGPPPYAETQAYIAQVLNRLAAQAENDR